MKVHYRLHAYLKQGVTTLKLREDELPARSMVSIFHKNDRVTLSDQSPSQHRAVERHPAVVFADDVSILFQGIGIIRGHDSDEAAGKGKPSWI